MADIIPLDNKRQSTEDKNAVHLRDRKLRAVQSVMQHVRDTSRCEKCGMATTGTPERTANAPSLRVPYRFCNGCSEEYTDYIDHLKGDGNPAHYWQQEEWLQSWSRWIDYQGTVDRYLKSGAFRALLDELKSNRPEE